MSPLSAACTGKLFGTWCAYTAGVAALSYAFDCFGLPGWTGWAAATILAVFAVERTLA